MNKNQTLSQNPAIKRGNLFRSMSLRNRLLLAFILLAILPVLITGTVASLISAGGLRNEAFNRLDAVASQKENEIKTLLKVLQTNLDLISEDNETQQNILLLLQNDTETEAVNARLLRNEIASFIEKTGYFTEAFILNEEGTIVLSTNTSQEEKIQKNQEYFIQGLTAPYVASPTYEVALSNYSILISQPIKNRFGKIVGVLAGRVNLSTLNDIMQQRSGLGETAELYLVSSNFAVLTDLQHGELSLGETYIRTEGVTSAIRNKTSGSATYMDHTDATVLGVYRWIPELQVALLAENDQSEALQASTRVFQTTVGLILVTVLAAIFMSFVVTRGITSPITKLVHIAENIAQGNLELQAEVSQDEIGVLAQAFNTMTLRLSDLINTLEQRVADRTKALATTTEVSRRLSNILDEKQLLFEVVEQIQSAYDYYHGQIYLLDDSGEALVLAGATGEGGKILLERGHRISIERGLVGRAARSKASVLVPDTSKEPEWLPNPLLPETKAEVVVPILLGDKLLGVIDMQDSVTGDIFPQDVEFLQAIANQVAVGLQNARSYAGVQARAQREALISSINQKIRGETTVESALQVAVREVGRALGGVSTKVVLRNSNTEKN